ncbi:DUF4238 domain-containing protein [Burkholderia sp. GbtcB21]|uniref:DUF4238 domain-containing protein n=1 Tax=Burkholderia sp. GbtcB21 TaxID=2824766 RepID=UPI001C2FF729|nr:DUF4238 domain-containing protein [Burkholderia sp. GbtcB21]
MANGAASQGNSFKSNHYVPQFLLQAWCVRDPRRNNELHLRQIGHRPHVGGPRVSPRTPSGVACVDFLYGVQLAARISTSVERDYFSARIDREGSDAYRTLISTGVGSLDAVGRKSWARFLVAQMARTPNMVKLLEKQIGESTDDVTVEQLTIGLDQEDREIVEELAQEIGPGVVGEAAVWLIQIISTLVRKKPFRTSNWLIRDASDACSELLLGDNPLILSSEDEDRDFICVLPLTPRKLFLAASSAARADQLKQVSINTLVKETNRYTTSQAAQSVFATDESLQMFIVKHLRQTP